MSKIIRIPWTQEQINSLKDRQQDTSQHPYTCNQGHILTPTKDGWRCFVTKCLNYKQDWALMADVNEVNTASPPIWPNTMDAQVWAEEFIKKVEEHPDIPLDRGTMIGWFANAVMAGYDKAIQQGEALTTERILDWRGLDILAGEEPCGTCGGCGYRSYGDTSTWRHRIGGQQITQDVCDKCWGSGSKDKPWPSWKLYVKPPDLTKLKEVYEKYKQCDVEFSAQDSLVMEAVKEVLNIK